MPYWSTPGEAFDDPDVMTGWARLAYEAALRSEKVTSRKKKPQKKTATKRSVAE